MVKKIPVLEMFLTIQGEGMVVGRKTVFIRTAGCDYSCSWCDSAFTWDGSEKDNIRMLTPAEIYSEMKEKFGDNFNHVTISGGNPALIGSQMGDLIEMLNYGDIEVGLETQGSIWREWFLQIDDLTISPKPPSSGMKTDYNTLGNIIHQLEKYEVNYSLKVVVFDDIDFEYAKDINSRYAKPNNKPLYLSVGNIDATEEGDISGRLLTKLGWLWDKVIEDEDMNNALPLPQLHTLVFANKRGV